MILDFLLITKMVFSNDIWENARHETILIPQACETSVNSYWILWCDTVVKQVALISHTMSPKLLLSYIQMKGKKPDAHLSMSTKGEKKLFLKDILYSV